MSKHTIMTITIPDELITNASAEDQQYFINIAVFLYDKRILTMGQAKRMAGLDQIAFQKEMATRDVYMNYDVEDYELDLKNLNIK